MNSSGKLGLQNLTLRPLPIHLFFFSSLKSSPILFSTYKSQGENRKTHSNTNFPWTLTPPNLTYSVLLTCNQIRTKKRKTFRLILHLTLLLTVKSIQKNYSEKKFLHVLIWTFISEEREPTGRIRNEQWTGSEYGRSSRRLRFLRKELEDVWVFCGIVNNGLEFCS